MQAGGLNLREYIREHYPGLSAEQRRRGLPSMPWGSRQDGTLAVLAGFFDWHMATRCAHAPRLDLYTATSEEKWRLLCGLLPSSARTRCNDARASMKGCWPASSWRNNHASTTGGHCAVSSGDLCVPRAAGDTKFSQGRIDGQCVTGLYPAPFALIEPKAARWSHGPPTLLTDE